MEDYKLRDLRASHTGLVVELDIASSQVLHCVQIFFIFWWPRVFERNAQTKDKRSASERQKSDIRH